MISVRALTVLALSLVVVLAGSLFLLEHTELHRLRIAASERGSESFELAQALAQVAETSFDDIEVEVFETQGSSQSIRLLSEGQVELAAVQGDTRPQPGARLVALLHPDAFQLVARRDAGISQFSDLRGKRVALPPRGSGQYRSFWNVAAHYQIGESDLQAYSLDAKAGSFALASGNVDAIFRVRAPGNLAIADLINRTPTRLVPIDQAAAMRLRHPSIEPGSIPKGSYLGAPPNPPVDLRTVQLRRLLVAQAAVESR